MEVDPFERETSNAAATPSAEDAEGAIAEPRLVDDLLERIAEFDAIAWNLPNRSSSAAAGRDEDDRG